MEVRAPARHDAPLECRAPSPYRNARRPLDGMVDIRDLKSRGPKGPCWFESSSGHQIVGKANNIGFMWVSLFELVRKTGTKGDMDMAIPKGMYLRGSMWWARKDVPKPLVEIVGRTSLKESLKTGDVAVARVRFHPVMARFEKEIADAWRTLKQEPSNATFNVHYRDLGFTEEYVEGLFGIEARVSNQGDADPSQDNQAAEDREGQHAGGVRPVEARTPTHHEHCRGVRAGHATVRGSGRNSTHP